MENSLSEKRVEKSRKESYEEAVRILSEQFSYEMTPAEAVDYLAVEKAGVPNGRWADVRDVDHSTVSGNLTGAREKINNSRLDAEVTSREDKIVVTVTDSSGQEHEIPFEKESSVMGKEGNTTLTLVYEAMGAIHGHYVGDDGTEYEGTGWFDGRVTTSFKEFDISGEWGSPKSKADTIFWSRDSEQ